MHKIYYYKAISSEPLGVARMATVPRIGEEIFFNFDGNNVAAFKVVSVEYAHQPVRHPDGPLAHDGDVIEWQPTFVSIYLEEDKDKLFSDPIPYRKGE
jgi:hypothetical protein